MHNVARPSAGQTSFQRTDDDTPAHAARASTDTGMPPPAPRRAAPQARPRNAAVQCLNAFGMAGLAYMVAAASYRGAMSGNTMVDDWNSNPLGMWSAVLRFEPRASADTMQRARDQVLEQFGEHIDPQSACFGSKAVVTDRSDVLPFGIAGRYSDKLNTVFVKPNHFMGAQSATIHEYLHCFTDPAFLDAALRITADVEQANDLNEGITQYLTRQVPVPWNQFHLTAYDIVPMGGGAGTMTPTRLAARIVEELGEDGEVSLRKAFLRGDPAELKRLDDALFRALPRQVTPHAWKALQDIGGPMPKRRPEKLAEMFLGSMLIHAPRHAAQALERVFEALPIDRRRRLTALMKSPAAGNAGHPSQVLVKIKDRTAKLREQFGAERFDSVFCRHNLDPRDRKALMKELADQWQQVLPNEVARELLAVPLG